jgi:hypothetical protein
MILTLFPADQRDEPGGRHFQLDTITGDHS